MFYVVHKGRVPGIYGNWNDCKKQIDKFDGAIFKKFDKKPDADAFLKNGFGDGKMPRGLTRKINSDKKNNDSIEDETLNDPSPKIFIYTDGSCIRAKNGPVKAGFGIYIPEKHIKVGAPLLNQKLTNNRAEMTAIIDAVKYLDQDDLQKKLCIFTDSQYSIYIFTGTGERYEKNGWKNEGKEVPNVDLIKKALELKRTYNIVLLKVRAHTDKRDQHSIGNDIADKLANEGAQQCGHQKPITSIFDGLHELNALEGDYYDEDSGDFVPFLSDNIKKLEINSPKIEKDIRVSELIEISDSNPVNFDAMATKTSTHKQIKTKYKSSKLSEWFAK